MTLLPFGPVELGQEFLNRLRASLDERRISRERLPPWLTAARVRAGWIGQTLLLVAEDATGKDQFAEARTARADIPILLDEADFRPLSASLQGRKDSITIGMAGSRASILNLVGERSALFDCGLNGYHGRMVLLSLFIQRSRADDPPDRPLGIRFIPFAVYAHLDDLVASSLWDLVGEFCVEKLADLAEATGEYYARHRTPAETFAHTKKSSVIVLGRDSGEGLGQLKQVRDCLKAARYEASLIKELPEIPTMSNEEKVRLWTAASRFSVMVDDVPAGHIAEYSILKSQRSILAVLRPKSRGSTYMIGDDPLVDLNHIRVFEFAESPVTRVAEAVEWAEDFSRRREEAYAAAYPWRTQ